MSYFNFGAENTTGEFNIGGDAFAPIPEGTEVIAIAENVKWNHFGGDPEYVDIQWSVQFPEQYKNRKVFQKLHTQSSDPAKAQKAMNTLGAINDFVGGNLRTLSSRPTDEQLCTALGFKKVGLKLGVWVSKEDFKTKQPLPEAEWKSGNWVSKVMLAKKPSETTQAAVQQAAAQSTALDSEDLPF